MAQPEIVTMKSVFFLTKRQYFKTIDMLWTWAASWVINDGGFVVFFVYVFFSFIYSLFQLLLHNSHVNAFIKAEKSLLLSYVMRFKRATSLGEHCMPPIGIKTSLTTGNSINFYTPTYFLAKSTHTNGLNGVNAHSDKYWIESETWPSL